MIINITFFIQIILFIFYILFCIKYIWPYVDRVLEKRKNILLVKFKKIKDAKLKINYLNKKIINKIEKNKKFFSKMKNELEFLKKKLIKKYKKKAKYEYYKIIDNAKLKIKIKKKNMYDNFNKNISNIINFLLKKITCKIFNKKLDNKFINKLLKDFNELN